MKIESINNFNLIVFFSKKYQKAYATKNDIKIENKNIRNPLKIELYRTKPVHVNMKVRIGKCTKYNEYEIFEIKPDIFLKLQKIG